MAIYFKIIILSVFLPAILSAQYDNPSTSSPKGQDPTGQAGQSIKFEHISVDQGLSNNKLRCTLQDKHGFIWIGTHDGLNKYDGYKFTIYRNNPDDSLSLSSNWITALYEDRSGQIWIATMGGGLNKFNLEKEQFTRYNHNIAKPWKGPNAITIKQIAEYQYGDEKVLWIGTWSGLNKMDLETQEFTHYPHTNLGHPYSHIQAVAVDKSGMVWVGSLKDGLHKFNPETERYIHYQNVPDNPNSLSDDQIFALLIDRKGILWIGTAAGGLNRFDPEKEKFTTYKYNANNPRSISSNNVISIFEDHAGVLWVGTADRGLNIFDRDTQEFTHFKHDPGDPTTLNDNTVWHIYEDRTGVLWLGTWGGVNKIVPRKKQFTDYKMIPGNPNSLSNNFSGPIHISTLGGSEVLWIGTRRGLNKIDRKTGKYTHYIHDPNNAKSISGNLINSIFEDRLGILWIGTYSNGLLKFDPLKEQFTNYSNDPENPNSISDNKVFSIFEDKYGILWIGTWDGGLDRLDRDKELFTKIGNVSAMHMLEDSSGELWMATWPGLSKYDRDSGKFITYYRNREAKNYPELNRNNYILESYIEEDVLWIGSYSGLNKFDRKSEKFINYTVKDGLPNNVINGILEDRHGNLWLSTNNGLSKFNSKTGSFKNYDVNDGLLSNQFSLGGCFKSKDGEMFFSGSKGVNAFYPDKLLDNPHSPKIVITDFQLYNKSVNIKKDNSNENIDTYLLQQHISSTKEIKLSYQENVFSFEFAALDYHSPQKNKYAYQMEGVDPGWVYTAASRRFANYTNLDPGEYIFSVKGSNNDGIWNEEGTSIKIIINPPWWQTWWFRIIAGMSIIGLLTLAYNYRISNLRKIASAQKDFSRKLIDSQEKDRKRIASELHDSHGQNLLIISNELQQYIMENKDSAETLKPLTETVQESINEIREISYDLHPHPLDRLGLKNAIESNIDKIENTTNINFTLQIDEVDGLFSKNVEINLYRIIQESINNIIKHSQATEAKIEIKKNIKYITILIGDNGKGFDKKKMLKEINGLGLTSMEERSKLIGGSFKIKSNVSKGTEIAIHIPINFNPAT